MGIIKVSTFDFYASCNPGASLSFVTAYVANHFDIFPEKLCEPSVYLHLLESLF